MTRRMRPRGRGRAFVIQVNPGATALDAVADLHVRQPAAATLPGFLTA